MSIEQLRENLATIEHERWGDWQQWCHRVLRTHLPDDYQPELDKVLERWDRQIETAYADLSDSEKASDLEQVDRYWPLIEKYIHRQRLEAQIGELQAVIDARDHGEDVFKHCVKRIATIEAELKEAA